MIDVLNLFQPLDLIKNDEHFSEFRNTLTTYDKLVLYMGATQVRVDPKRYRFYKIESILTKRYEWKYNYTVDGGIKNTWASQKKIEPSIFSM